MRYQIGGIAVNQDGVIVQGNIGIELAGMIELQKTLCDLLIAGLCAGHMVGHFDKAYVDDVEIGGVTKRCLVAEGTLDEMRYPKFVAWLRENMADSVVKGSVEIVGKPEHDGYIIYSGGWKEEGRVPQYYDYSGYAILSVKPADEAAIVMELNSIALDMEYAEDMIGVDAGTVIKLSIGDQEIPVTVSGLFINNELKNGHGPLALDNTCMVATKELFEETMPMIDCFDYSWSIVSDPQKAEQIESSLSAIISSDPDLDLDTIGIHKDYEEMENRVVFGGLQALSWLVFLFGVVNLINTTLSNQMSRKRENSVFRAIGLTRKQLCQMTI